MNQATPPVDPVVGADADAAAGAVRARPASHTLVGSVPDFEKKFCETRLLRQRARALPRPLVMTNGVFDLLHRGHVTGLAQARALGAALLVAVNDDVSAGRLQKGTGRPFNRCEDRMAVLAALASTDIVTCFGDNDAAAIVELVQPDIYVKGGDYDVTATPEGRAVIARGGRAAALPFVHYTSTTMLAEKIRGSV